MTSDRTKVQQQIELEGPNQSELQEEYENQGYPPDPDEDARFEEAYGNEYKDYVPEIQEIQVVYFCEECEEWALTEIEDTEKALADQLEIWRKEHSVSSPICNEEIVIGKL